MCLFFFFILLKTSSSRNIFGLALFISRHYLNFFKVTLLFNSLAGLSLFAFSFHCKNFFNFLSITNFLRLNWPFSFSLVCIDFTKFLSIPFFPQLCWALVFLPLRSLQLLSTSSLHSSNKSRASSQRERWRHSFVHLA